MTTNNNELPALLPCPFCGGEAVWSIGMQGDAEFDYIECIDCAASGDMEGYKDKALLHWNTRTDTTAQQRIEELEAILSSDIDVAEFVEWSTNKKFKQLHDEIESKQSSVIDGGLMEIINQQGVEIESLQAKLAVAVDGIKEVRENSYRKLHSAGDACLHGRFRYEHCSSCLIEHLDDLIKQIPSL